jgi:hypothetical protein
LNQLQQDQTQSLKEENKKLRELNRKLKKEISILRTKLRQVQSRSEKKQSHLQNQQSSSKQKLFHEFLVEKYLNNPNLNKIIGITKTQFKILLSRIRISFSETNVRGEQRQYQKTKEGHVSCQTHLYITLCWLRHYETITKLSHDFGLTNWRIQDILLRTLKVLDATLEDELK